MNRAVVSLYFCLASSLVLAQSSSLQDIEARLNKAKATQAYQAQQQREAQQQQREAQQREAEREAERQAEIEAQNRERYRQQEAARQQQVYQAQQVAAAQQAAEQRRREQQQCRSQCSQEANQCLNYINPGDCQRTNNSSPQAAQAQLFANMACIVGQGSRRKTCNNQKAQCEQSCN